MTQGYAFVQSGFTLPSDMTLQILHPSYLATYVVYTTVTSEQV